MKTKSAVVITEEQARVMSADEVARLLRLIMFPRIESMS